MMWHESPKSYITYAAQSIKEVGSAEEHRGVEDVLDEAIKVEYLKTNLLWEEQTLSLTHRDAAVSKLTSPGPL